MGEAAASGSGEKVPMHGTLALSDSFDKMCKSENIGLKDLAPLTAYEWLLSDEQKKKFQEIGKDLYMSAAHKRHASVAMKSQEKKAKRARADDVSETERVRSLFTSR